jgi:hypothetical protein
MTTFAALSSTGIRLSMGFEIGALRIHKWGFSVCLEIIS